MDPRFTQAGGRNVFNGNELLVKGALEAGASLLVGYPGSPVADVFEVAGRLHKLLDEKGIVAQVANNEALTAARLNGSQMAAIRAVGFMKSVGLHVAADGLAISNLAGAHPQGGVAVVVGDDPWTDSTQVPADSRFLLEHLHMPIVEPATFQEVKDWLDLALDLSAYSRLYVGYLVTTNQADGGGTVCVRPNVYPELNARHRAVLETSALSPDDRVMLPPETGRYEIELATVRFPRLLQRARELGLNRILYAAGGTAGFSSDARAAGPEGTRRDAASTLKRPLGIVTSGMAYNYVEHALDELGIAGRVPILKLGVIYPVDPELLLEFAAGVDEIVVLEERREFIEQQVAGVFTKARQQDRIEFAPPVWGKQFPDGLAPIPAVRGLNPSLVIRHLVPLLKRVADPKIGLDLQGADAELARIRECAAHEITLPVRTPAFCPGCPHRDSASVMKDMCADLANETYTQIHHNCGAQDVVFHGDIGCYVMLKYEPYKRLMHNLSGMGLGGGTGAGIDPFIENKQVVFMGDSTFFHSGMAAISDSIKNGQNITYVILDNQTTAMTGHQPTPAQGVDVLGHETVAQDIERIVRAMAKPDRSRMARSHAGRVRVYKTNPGKRDSYRKLVESCVLKPGVKVIIADKECAITAGRRERRERRAIVNQRGFLPREQHIGIAPEVCEHCLECTRATGCTGLTFIDTDYGRKVATDDSFCVSDGACSKRMVCPSFEKVEVRRKASPPSRWPWADAEAVRCGDAETSGFSEKPGAYAHKPLFPDLPEVPPAPLAGTYNLFLAGVGGMGVGTITAILARAAQEAGIDCLFCDKKGLAIRNGGVYSRMVFSVDGRPRSPLVPYGKAHAILGLDLLEAARGLDPRAHLNVAHPSRTAAIVNTHETPSVKILMGHEHYDAPRRLQQLRRRTRHDAFWALDLFHIAQRVLGHKLYANMMLLGMAYQKRLLPVGLQDLEQAIRQSIAASELDANLRAFRLGRLLALKTIDELPELKALLEPAPVNPERLHDLIEDKARILRRRWPGGLVQAEGFRMAMEEAVVAMPDLDENTLRDLALRLYDLIQYQNLRYARRQYLDRVIETYRRDRRQYDYRATKAVIWYLYKAIAIKDEVWVSHLLTSEEKRRHDHERYQIDPARGDRIKYVHLNRPEFYFLGLKVRFRIRTRPWMLRIMKRLKFLRRMPGWHARERYFRDKYMQLVDHFQFHSPEAYDEFVAVLRCPEEVRGYVEVRYPTMVEPLRRIEAILENPLFRDPPRRPIEAQAVEDAHAAVRERRALFSNRDSHAVSERM